MYEKTPGREFRIDLSLVTTPEQLLRALAEHLPMGPDPREVREYIHKSIELQPCPYRIWFIGWPTFAERMPRYAKWMRTYFRRYQNGHGPYGVNLLAVHYE